jgi:hypothetical protein
MQTLDEVQAQLDVLSGSCSAISTALATARVTASGLLTDADKAARQLSALDAKAKLVEEFLVKYQLTPEEVGGLQGWGWRGGGCPAMTTGCVWALHWSRHGGEAAVLAGCHSTARRVQAVVLQGSLLQSFTTCTPSK